MNVVQTFQSAKKSFFSKNPSLQSIEFRRLLLLRIGVIFALNMQATILYYWVYQLTNNKLSLGFVGLAEVIPAIGCSLFAGHFVDLNEKKKMVSYALIGYIITAVGLFLLSSSYFPIIVSVTLKVWMVYGLVFVGGVLRTFFVPAMFSLFGLIVPRAHYPNGTSWSSMAWQIGAVLGPLVAGIFIGCFGIETGLLWVGIFLLLMFIPLMGISKKPIVKKEKEPMLESIREGIKFVFKTPTLLGAQLLDMFSVLFGGAVALLPVYQKEILHVDEMGFGILRAAPGIGAIFTFAILAFLPLQRQPGKKLFLCVTGFAVSIIIFGISTNFILSFLMLLCSGMFDAVSVVIRSTILQLVTPDAMRGRVSAVNTIFVSSSNEFGDFESGVMANWLGTVRAVVTGGVLTLGVIAFTYAKVPKLRNFSFETKSEE
ncbi:MFS transporter [Flavobacterium aciduliphilum]|uniref:Na+/melibiose symporter-like transporter n=1 Tax=Flavobacterium aciduliphilum TaxID=1101402 RepID=A0A328YB04_9FLAO|nr:MFS transporter [Flavobacterium aciduliphilum]RAR70790.1 Na+/melibiose symporter-like transporter [Flavobacterium aciduliphilum]